MVRPLRVEYPGALYHVIARGNAYQDIVVDDKDRKGFLYWLKDTIEIHNLVCHAYCLMDNHYHLLFETPDANLSRAMQDLNGNYSQWFNTRHGRVGHLFQGRFKSMVIEKESYLLEVSRYIVLNPIRANIVKQSRSWKWSSYNATAGIARAPNWLHTDWLLGHFSKSMKKAQVEYRNFIIAGIDRRDPHEDLENNFILGTPQFVHWIWNNYTNGSEHMKDHPREQRIVGRPSLDEIFSDVSNVKERDKAICFARIRCGYLISEIAQRIQLDASTVGKIARDKYNSK